MTLRWRLKQRHQSQKDESTSPHDTITIHRHNLPSDKQVKEKVNTDIAIDFKHRSNRYRQYSGNNQSQSQSHSQRGYRNYKCDSAAESSLKKQGKNEQDEEEDNDEDQDQDQDQEPAIIKEEESPYTYLKCQRPEIEAIRQNNLKYLGEFDYFIGEKSDGMNVLCYITQNSVYFVDEAFNIRMVSDVFYCSHGLTSMNKLILFDGELIVSKRTNKYQEKYIFYRITDCVAFDGESVSNQNVAQRHVYIDKFINNYNLKLIEYAKHKNKLKKDKEEWELDKFCAYEPFDEQDTPKKRLLQISTKMDNNYQHTRSMKNKIMSLCKGQGVKCGLHLFDDEKISISQCHENVLNAIELDAVSVLFIKQNICKATKDNLHNLSLHIKYYDDSIATDEEGYFFVDPQTGIETKNDGILFIPRYSGNSNANMIRIWKTKDLLTVDVKLKIVRKETAILKKGKNMNNFIDLNKLNLYIYDDIKEKDVWFNSIDMGQNDEINSHNTPFWDDWHLKQRSKLSVFISEVYEQSKNVEYFIVECNYDFFKRSWSLLKLKSDKNKPSSLQNVQDIISRMEECIDINDIIMALK